MLSCFVWHCQTTSEWNVPRATVAAWTRRLRCGLLLDARIMNPDGGVLPWVCLPDDASTDIRKEFWSRVSLELSHVRLCFIPPGATSSGQPLGRAFIKAFKISLARHAVARVARVILHAPDSASHRRETVHFETVALDHHLFFSEGHWEKATLQGQLG